RPVGLGEEHLRHAANRDPVQHIVAFKRLLKRFVHTVAFATTRVHALATRRLLPERPTRQVFYTKSMSPRVAGRTLFVWILTGACGAWCALAAVGAGLGGAYAHAEPPPTETPDLKLTSRISFSRRPVAVIDLSNDPSVRDVASKL